MRETMILVMVLSFAVGCGCGDEEEATVEDAGTKDSRASTDSATDEDVGTTMDSGIDATNGQQFDAGFDSGITRPPPTLQDLNGTWFGPCYSYNGERIAFTLIFSDQKMNFQVGFYPTADCENRAMFIDTEMAISIPDPAESSLYPGAYRLDFEVRKVTCTVTNEEAVDIANSTELFGFTDWQVGEPKDIVEHDSAVSDNDAGMDDSDFPQIGDQSEFLFAINVLGDQLLIGDLGLGSQSSDIYWKQ